MTLRAAGRLLTVEGQGVETDFTRENGKVAKKHGSVKETAVLGFVPLGGVSEAPGVWLFVDQTVGRQFSAHSKPEVT